MLRTIKTPYSYVVEEDPYIGYSVIIYKDTEDSYYRIPKAPNGESEEDLQDIQDLWGFKLSLLLGKTPKNRYHFDEVDQLIKDWTFVGDDWRDEILSELDRIGAGLYIGCSSTHEDIMIYRGLSNAEKRFLRNFDDIDNFVKKLKRIPSQSIKTEQEADAFFYSL